MSVFRRLAPAAVILSWAAVAVTVAAAVTPPGPVALDGFARSIPARFPGPGTQSPPPAFNPVTIDFRALDGQGRAILDLSPADVTLRIDGRTRQIQSLGLIDHGRPPTSAAPPFASNRRADAGRDLLLLVEDESIAPGRERTVTSAVEELIGALGPRDRIGLVTIPHGGVNVNFTRRYDAVRQGLAGIRGLASRSASAGDIACRTRVTLATLKATFEGLPTDAPTTVVLFSSSLTAPPVDPRARMSESSGLCQVRTEDFTEVAEAALASRGDLFVAVVLDGTTLAGSASASTLAAGLESLAGVTEGQLVRLTGDQPGAMARLALETSAFYRATFEPDETERDGNTHRVEVRVARDGVTVRARSRVPLTRPEGRPRASSPAPALRDLIRAPSPARELALRATAYAARDTHSRTVRVVALFEPADPSATLASAAVALFDGEGRLTAQWTATSDELARAPLMTALPVRPGTYRMRVVATDDSGRGGAVDGDVRAALIEAPPLRLSGLLLGVPDGGAIAPRLLFTDDRVAVGYLEVYGAPESATVTATVELAYSEDGPAVVSRPARIHKAPGDRLVTVHGGLQIDALPPGDVVVRMLVAIDGRVVGRATRTLRKTVR